MLLINITITEVEFDPTVTLPHGPHEAVRALCQLRIVNKVDPRMVGLQTIHKLISLT